MGQCEYGKDKKEWHYDFDKKNYITYQCPRNALLHRNRCEFHDEEYAQNNPDDVMKLFYDLIDDAIQNVKQLDCAGFYLPGKVDLTDKEFKNGVSFSNATFTKEAIFSDARFTKEAIFLEATFTKEAIFSDARFTKEALFSHTSFSGRADFDKSTFSIADFTDVDFNDEVSFSFSEFPSPKVGEDLKDKNIPIKFGDFKFGKTVRFIGGLMKPLELGLVSFKGTDLSNVEFHNVKWQLKTELLFFSRRIIIDEIMLEKIGITTRYFQYIDS